MDFFVNPEDLRGWVKSQPSSEEAANKIMELTGREREQDVIETCKVVYDTGEDNASKVLFGILSQHKLSQLKEANNMNKQAQSSPSSRQRNGWERGMRNKWNRVVDGFNEGTPWRIDRDKFFNFTHYYTDALQFDADPTKVYSGEAIWRMYIMDKFTREYQNKEGKWVGGYINDRFYVFPDAGTPDNPDNPRDGGNQMGLPPGIKTRKPRPHQYSTERRLEEARGTKTKDLEAFASKSDTIIKISSIKDTEREEDKIYGIFKDTIDMREAGIDYEVMLDKVSSHYDVSVLGVAQIDKVAQSLKSKHVGIRYQLGKEAATNMPPIEFKDNINYKVLSTIIAQSKNGPVKLVPDTQIMATDIVNYKFVDDRGNEVTLSKQDLTNNNITYSEMGAEVGLLNDDSPRIPNQNVAEDTAEKPEVTQVEEAPADFPVVENSPFATNPNSAESTQAVQ